MSGPRHATMKVSLSADTSGEALIELKVDGHGQSAIDALLSVSMMSQFA